MNNNHKSAIAERLPLNCEHRLRRAQHISQEAQPAVLSRLRWRFAFSLLALLLTSSLALAGTEQQANHQALVLSDIHFSPFAECPSSKNCELVSKLNQANASQWPQILAKYSTNTLPANYQATNYTLFKSMLAQLQQQKPEQVLILGDFLAHRYRSEYLKYSHDRNRDHYRAFVLNTLQYMVNAIQQALPDTANIYPVIGNNDSYGGQDCDYSDYCVITNGAFYQALATQWSGLLRDPDNKTRLTTSFPSAGYYEATLPDTHDHIIVLNTVLFSTKIQGPNSEKTAQQQLQWLQQTLQTISNAQEKTWIIFHIPPGIDAYSTARSILSVTMPFWDKDYTQQFLNLVHQYNTTITGVLSGHTHMDGFMVLDTKGPNILVDTFVASISPIFGNNPSYKIYTYDTKHFVLHNFATYYLDLHSTTQWQKEYEFSATYQPDNGLYTGYQKITANKTNPFSAEYIRLYSVSTNSQPINHNKWDYYWCAIYGLNPQSYQHCLKKTNHENTTTL